MRSRILLVGLALFAPLGLIACGGSGGTGAPPQTTIKLNAASFITEPPIIESTTIAASPVGGGTTSGTVIVPGPQTYVAKTGDYLFNIAKKFCTQAQTIADYNQWEGINHKFFAGDTINIPPNSCDPASVTQATTVSGASTNATTPVGTSTTVVAGTFGKYTVVANDYLGGIAKKVGTTVDAIVAANGWADGAKHNINPGDVINVPNKAG